MSCFISKPISFIWHNIWIALQGTYLKLNDMKKSVLAMAAIMVLIAGPVNLEAQPGYGNNRKAKNPHSPKAYGLHDNRGKNRYRIVPPPYGIRVSFIPRECLSVRFRGIPYFYFEGVFYRHYNSGGYYEVVAPPLGVVITRLPDHGVRNIIIDGRSVYEYDNIIYLPLETMWGVPYKVIRILNNNFYSYNY